ncbi:MAG: hypothetical protein HYV52_01395 [Parcubacteria group bacterium]|nr:hypothetical protein [Parcubacteria group bacterium]
MNYFKKLSLVVILSLSILGTAVPYDVFLDLSKNPPQVSVEKNSANAAVKTFYLHQEVSGMAGTWIMRDGTVPDQASNTTSAITSPASAVQTVIRPGVTSTTTGTPGATPQPYGWFSNAQMSGTFAAGTWTFNVRKTDNRANVTSHPAFQVFRVPQDTSLTGAVLLFSHDPTAVDWWTGGASTINTASSSVGPFTLANEYLYLEVWDHNTVVSSGRTLNFIVEGSELADADRTKMTTPDFSVGPAITTVDLTEAGAETTCPTGSSIASGIASARQSDTISINGAGFGATQDASTLTINGSANIVVSPTTNWTDAAITTAIPSDAGISGNITVTVSGQSSNFAFTILPRLCSIADDAGTIEGPGQIDTTPDDQIGKVIALNGDHFGTAGAITINASAATQITGSTKCAGSAYTNTCIAVRVPGQEGSTNITGTISVSRSTPITGTSNTRSFTIFAPTVTSVAPTFGINNETAKSITFNGAGIDTDDMVNNKPKMELRKTIAEGTVNLLDGNTGCLLTDCENSGSGKILATPSLTIFATDGFARISYRDDTNGDLKYVRCKNIDCTDYTAALLDGGTGCVLTGCNTAENTGHYNSITLDNNGFAMISYTSYTSGILKYAHCADLDCSTGTVAILDGVTGCVLTNCATNGANGTSFTSIIKGSDGFARIVHNRRTGSSSINFSRCFDIGCSSGVITSVAGSGCVLTDCSVSTGNGAGNPSFALASNDFGKIIFTTGGGETGLRYINCTHLDCASGLVQKIDGETGCGLIGCSTTSDPGVYNSIFIANDGFARISYLDSTNSNLRYAKCSDLNCSTGAITVVDGPSCVITGCDTGALSITNIRGIKGSDDGFARIVYRLANASPFPLKYFHCSAEDCSAGVFTGNISGGVLTYASNPMSVAELAFGSGNFLRVVFVVNPIGSSPHLNYIRCVDIDCVSVVRNAVEIFTANNQGSYIKNILGQDGFSRIVYQNDSPASGAGFLKYIRCANSNCSAGIIRTLDGGSNCKITGCSTLTAAGSYPSIAIGSADGFARIAYQDSNLDLKFIRCADLDCSTGVMNLLDGNTGCVLTNCATGDSGRFTSIAVGSDGFPRIVYGDPATSQVKYAKCADINCASGIITPISGTGCALTGCGAGYNANSISLALNPADDFGRVVFDNRFISCSDANCAVGVSTDISSSNNSSMALGSDNLARIVSINPLRYIRCPNTACTGATVVNLDGIAGCVLSGCTTSTAILSPNDTPSLILDSNQYPAIAYYKYSTESSLRFARCNDANCSAGVVKTLDGDTGCTLSGCDTDAFTGSFASLVLDSTDGLAKIAYKETNNGVLATNDLKYVKCLTDNCSGVLAIPGASVTINTAYTSITGTFNLNAASLGFYKARVTNQDTQIGEFGDGSTTGFEVRATAPVVTSVSPSSGFDNGTISSVSITGANFTADTLVKLATTSQTDILSSPACAFASSTSMTGCGFDLTDKLLGNWTVVASNSVGSGSYSPFTVLDAKPIDPTALNQYRTDGSTAITTAGSTNESSVIFKMSMAGGKTNQTYYPQVEVKPIAQAFDGTGIVEGTGVLWTTGTATGQVTVSGLVSGTSYHWQARVRSDTVGGTNNTLSNWVSFGGNPETSADFMVDTTPPVVNLNGGSCGTAYSGVTASTANISFNASDLANSYPISAQIEYDTDSSLTTPNALSSMLSIPENEAGLTKTINLLNLTASTQYFFRVSAKDSANNGPALNPSATPFCSLTTGTTSPSKTVEFFIFQEKNPTSPIATPIATPAITKKFRIRIPENNIQIKSAAIEINGTTQGGTNQTMDLKLKRGNLGATGYGAYPGAQFTFSSPASALPFKLLYDATSVFTASPQACNACETVTDLNGVSNTTKEYTLHVSPTATGSTVYLLNAKIILTYSYTP